MTRKDALLVTINSELFQLNLLYDPSYLYPPEAGTRWTLLITH